LEKYLGLAWILASEMSSRSNSSLGGGLVRIEHNLDVIRCSDLIINLGPEGGDQCGQIVVTGTPEEVAAHPTSHTGRYLKQVLAQHPPSQEAA
jgi:excinuclease ABC subunit A